jgi:hypothetical protein
MRYVEKLPLTFFGAVSLTLCRCREQDRGSRAAYLQKAFDAVSAALCVAVPAQPLQATPEPLMEAPTLDKQSKHTVV